MGYLFILGSWDGRIFLPMNLFGRFIHRKPLCFICRSSCYLLRGKENTSKCSLVTCRCLDVHIFCLSSLTVQQFRLRPFQNGHNANLENHKHGCESVFLHILSQKRVRYPGHITAIKAFSSIFSYTTLKMSVANINADITHKLKFGVVGVTKLQIQKIKMAVKVN